MTAAASLAFIGFGEAGAAFAEGMASPVAAYDRKTDVGETRQAKLDDYVRLGIAGASSNGAAVADAGVILSLVTADRALSAAQESAPGIAPGALYCDMNSVAPETKRAAAAVIEAAGGRYVDVAVMAPVDPLRRAAPLRVSGPYADAAAEALAKAGFSDVRTLPGPVGAASSVKMIRSVMVKGLEALSAECALAADRAGVFEEVIASLDASWPGADWTGRTDYNLGRMMVHGLRRAEEMEEVVKTLGALGVGDAMSRGTIQWQRAIGRLGLDPGQPLAGKLRGVFGHGPRRAA